MANGTFNIALGRVNELVNRVDSNDPANSAIIVVLLETAEADATLQDYDDLSTLLAAAGNTEAAFTNYARKTLTDADLTAPSPDDTGNLQLASIGNQTWTSAGGAANETLAKAIICYDSDTTAGTDANIIPLTYHDFTPTTDGNDLILQEPATGFFSAANA